MKFKKGRYRFVLILPSLGMVIKLPFIRLFKAAAAFKTCVMQWDSKWFTTLMSYGIDQEGIVGFRHLLVGGIVFNWREFIFSNITGNPFLQPTYFSLFGLINIQKLGAECLLEKDEFWCQLREITSHLADDDGHHFRKPENFCFDGKNLRIIDYGNKKTQLVVTECGAKIFESFDPSPDWKEKRAEAAQRAQ